MQTIHRCYPLVFLLVASTTPLVADESGKEKAYWLHRFDRIHLDETFYSEGATFGDVSGDGVPDIISGPHWYEGPSFEKKHEYSPPRPFSTAVYSDNFFAFVHDLDQDGAKDILIIGFPGKDASWYVNPRAKGGHWRRHVVFDQVDNESPTFADLTGDGKPELVCCTKGYFGYAEPDWDHPEKKWKFTAISRGRKVGRFTHGLGFGDINGDGRNDVMERQGWYEQPASLDGDPLWKYHPYPFSSGRGGAQMYAYDIDGDGDGDVITSINAHGWGLVWHENVKKEGETTFVEHRIMGSLPEHNRYGVNFSQLHAIDLVDMDGDGLKDIVTGKRYWAHQGKDPGGSDAPVVYWFRLVREASGQVDFVPYRVDDRSGVGTQVVAGDVNGDGLPDVVVGNKQGTFVFLHRKRQVSRAEWEEAQPRAAASSGLSPRRAAAAMSVPDGFQVKLVAGEPDLHQPVAMTIDHRGRLWIAAAYSYPRRRQDDEGKDTILIFEDSDGDGTVDKRTVFKDDLNLISGLEVGFGGVWVGAAPYLMFIPDRDGDDRPDGPPEVLLDGWGDQDTHETLNSFIWGPDGWLYGCHGVFTHSRVGKPGTADADRVPVNAALWRYHPTRHRFEVFAWGTSNPWGVDFNDYGQAVLTACVIPHLYHVIHGARYQRQAGRHFNPHVYDDIKTIADHLHHGGKRWTPEHAAVSDSFGGGHAHCGAMVYLGDSFPDAYRGKIFMNNIHGNRVNVDSLERRGSGYVGRHEEDFLLANDRWFRGINLRYGPDGSVYFIDWYDEQACHRVDPLIWDRTNGRLYNVAYRKAAPATVDLSKLTGAELVRLQLHKNDWFVRTARRVLQERGANAQVHAGLLSILRENPDETRKLRALWALHVTGGLSAAVALEQLGSPAEYVRAWTIQLVTEGTLSGGFQAEPRAVSGPVLAKFAQLSREDPSFVVRLYLASALQRLPLSQRWPIARGLAQHREDAGDHNLPLMVWYGIEALAANDPGRSMRLAAESRIRLLSRYITRRVASNVGDLEPIMTSLEETDDEDRQLLTLEETIRAFEGRANLAMPDGWRGAYEKLSRSANSRIRECVQTIAVKFGDTRVFPSMRDTLASRSAPVARRRHAMAVLLEGPDPLAVPVLESVLGEPALRGEALRGLARYEAPTTPTAILRHYTSLTGSEKIDAINTLASRPSYSRALLLAVKAGKLARTELSAFTIRQLSTFEIDELDKLIAEVWGTVKPSSADKVALIEKYKRQLTPEALKAADSSHGRTIFASTCLQCHRLFGTGGTISPDLTGSNRANLDYVLENVLDPNATVGKDYQLNIFVMADGRVVSGLVQKETESALTVRTINEEVVIARDAIVEKRLSSASLMPEGLIAEFKENEVRDLVAYLASPAQVPLRGTPTSIDPETHQVAGAIEGEKLKVLANSRGSARFQDMAGFGRDQWSANRHLYWTGGRPGDRLELELPVAKTGTYKLEVALTKARDYGVVQFFLDGEPIEFPIDLYDPRVVPTGTLRLGEFELEAVRHRLGVEIIGAHPKAVKAYMFGLDYVLLSGVE